MRLTAREVLALALGAGFTQRQAETMAVIAWFESEWNPGNVGDLKLAEHGSRGLWQIFTGAHDPSEFGLGSGKWTASLIARLAEPAVNAHAARVVFQEQGFTAWSTYNDLRHTSVWSDKLSEVRGLPVTKKVTWRGVTLDARTADMMNELDKLVGKIPLHPTQGSYHDGPLSAGTHNGGGAIDLSIHGLTHDNILTVIKYANQIGFEASWWRTFPEWTQGDHIHMIATGAPDLNVVAANQITAVRAGFNGLGHLGRGGPDRHKKLRTKGRTWEKYKALQKTKGRAAGTAATAAAVASTVLATQPVTAPPAPKPAIVHPVKSPVQTVALGKHVKPGNHDAQVGTLQADLKKLGYGHLRGAITDFYGPATQAAVRDFHKHNPTFGTASDSAIGPKGFVFLQKKAG